MTACVTLLYLKDKRYSNFSKIVQIFLLYLLLIVKKIHFSDIFVKKTHKFEIQNKERNIYFQFLHSNFQTFYAFKKYRRRIHWSSGKLFNKLIKIHKK